MFPIVSALIRCAAPQNSLWRKIRRVCECSVNSVRPACVSTLTVWHSILEVYRGRVLREKWCVDLSLMFNVA